MRPSVRMFISGLATCVGGTGARWRTIQSAPFVFASDASLQGFGFYLEAAPPLTDTTGWPWSLQLGSGFLGVYSPADAQLHAASGQINWCEVFAMYAALSTYRTALRDCCVLFMCDNSTGVHILNKQSTRADGFSGVLRAIFAIAMECNISIYAQHRPGEQNVLPDFLSRPEHHHNAANVVDVWRAAHPLSARAAEAYNSSFLVYRFASNTVRAFSTQERNFLSICGRAFIDLGTPINEVDLAFVTAVYASADKCTTVAGFLSAIAQLAKRLWGETYVLPRGVYFQVPPHRPPPLLRELRRSTLKAALFLEDLAEFSFRMRLQYFEEARDWCACVFTFFGLLRINEYMGGARLHQHVLITPSGIDITIVRSKTSNTPVVVSITARGDVLCPVQSYRHLLGSIAVVRLPAGSSSTGFLTRYRHADNTEQVAVMQDAEFVTRLRALITTVFPNRIPAHYAGHSFRRGRASALLLAGVEAAVIQRHGRWTSDMSRRYIDTANSPAVRLLATRSLLP